ncbi:MAG: ribosomal protein S18-alanine N-acetyltransferase [Pyrinomonadaceae bacterium]|nr:ribosomal protein S18-alanine N-acetyltransferase [Pyrinomonadaceae bacterium]
MQKIRELLELPEVYPRDAVVPAPPTTYKVKPLTVDHLSELLRLSVRCFRGSETYNRETFEYLLREPQVLAYQVMAEEGAIVGFVFVLTNKGRIAHITTVAVAPEHRKRGIARLLLDHAEKALQAKGFESIVLEVRVSNLAAQNLYTNRGFVIIQKLSSYYNDGEDAFLMTRSLMS